MCQSKDMMDQSWDPFNLEAGVTARLMPRSAPLQVQGRSCDTAGKGVEDRKNFHVEMGVGYNVQRGEWLGGLGQAIEHDGGGLRPSKGVGEAGEGNGDPPIGDPLQDTREPPG